VRPDVRLDVDTFVVPVAGQPAEARVLVTAEIAGAGDSIAAVGYEIIDAASGKTAADTFDAPPVLRPVAGGRQLYLAAVPLPAGDYRVKLGVISTTGIRGSVAHTFSVPAWPRSGPRIGDLVLGADGASGFRPVTTIGPELDALMARVELHADTAQVLDGLTARMTIGTSLHGAPIDTRPMTIVQVGTDNLRAAAVATWNPAGHPPGRYVVTVVIESAGNEVARIARAYVRH
jgi:hypothetical protein